MPVVSYFADAPLAEQLKSDAERAGAAFDLLQWLRSRFPLQEPAPQELIAGCGQASDRAALRKELRLDYARFNAALLDLGESPLSNEAELRSMYEAYVRRMGPRILERLRRRHAADFREERDLAVHVHVRKRHHQHWVVQLRRDLARWSQDPALVRRRTLPRPAEHQWLRIHPAPGVNRWVA